MITGTACEAGSLKPVFADTPFTCVCINMICERKMSWVDELENPEGSAERMQSGAKIAIVAKSDVSKVQSQSDSTVKEGGKRPTNI